MHQLINITVVHALMWMHKQIRDIKVWFPTRKSLGHPMLTPIWSSIGIKPLFCCRFFMHPLNGWMVMLRLWRRNRKSSYFCTVRKRWWHKMTKRGNHILFPQVLRQTADIVFIKFGVGEVRFGLSQRCIVGTDCKCSCFCDKDEDVHPIGSL